MGSVIQPNEWAGFKLPSGAVKLIQVIPNTTLSLGKYGSFPSNLIIHRPYHLTYEVQDKREGEAFSRLRVVPAQELRADILADVKSTPDGAAEDEAAEGDTAAADTPDILADAEPEAVKAVGDAVVAAVTDESVRQTLTTKEIEILKRDGASAGKDLIAKLLSSHKALDQKTAYSLEKYKLLKTKKYIRRFEVVPLDTPLLTNWLLEEKDGMKVLEMRQEMLALLGCWGNVHCAVDEPEVVDMEKTGFPSGIRAPQLTGGRWLVVDDTGGLLVAAMAERMGILHARGPAEEKQPRETKSTADQLIQQVVKQEVKETADTDMPDQPNGAGQQKDGQDTVEEAPKGTGSTTEPQVSKDDGSADATLSKSDDAKPKPRARHYDRDDMEIPYAGTNTLTLIHANSQPNLAFLKYYDFDFANPNPPFASHPLHSHLTWLNWLQLLEPEEDAIYATELPTVPQEELLAWKGNRRGVYHRKRRRWARTRFVVDSTRAGGFSGLVTASTLDPVSLLRHALPLLAPGAPVAIYSQNIEPLTQLADCFSVARRAAWVQTPPPEAEGLSLEELERWPGTEDFPLNPGLLLGTGVQTSRVRQWQVLPGRTHPLMTGRGGSEGYIFTAWKALPAEGKVEARGRHKRKKTAAPAATPAAAA